MPASPRKAALLIGNGQFDDDPELAPLTAPSADVKELRRVLEDPSIGGFDDVQVLMDANFEKAYRAVGDLFRDKSRDDTILLYYSGHGLPDDRGELYLATRDTLTAQPDGRAIHAAEIKRMMGTSNSERQVLVLDCCYSGAFGAAKGGAQLPIVAQTFKIEGRGRHVLTASRNVERAYEGEQEIEGIETSLFTHFLIEGLETGKAAGEGEEQVTVGALYKYARDGVTSRTNKMRPQIWVSEGEGDLVVARNPKPFRLPDDLERMLKSERPLEREGAVRILGEWLHGSDPAKRNLARRVLKDHNAREHDRSVGKAFEGVLQQPNGTDEPAASDEPAGRDEPPRTEESTATEGPAAPSMAVRVVRQLERLWSIVPVAFVLVIGALAGAVYIEPQLTSADKRAIAAEEARDEVQAALTRLAAESDEVRAALTSTTHERDEARAALKEELRRRGPSDETYAVRALRAHDASSKCGGRVVDDTGFQCPIDDEFGPVMLVIPSGSFTMGSPENEADRSADEVQHAVSIKRHFAIGKYQVTFAEYELFARATDRETPSDHNFGKGRRPVIDVSWDEARAYAKWLSELTEQPYRLPTEAEWEYAARAGTTGPFSFEGPISPNKANYNARASYAGSETGEPRNQTERVGSFFMHANRWGLNDVHGNVWEWVEDCYGPYAEAPTNGTARRGVSCFSRVIRGGSWRWAPRFLRSASRRHQVLDGQFNHLGFRLAQDL